MAVARYEHAGTERIWGRANELAENLKVWAHVVRASAMAGKVDAGVAAEAYEALTLLAADDAKMEKLVVRVDEIEAETKHNIIAVTRALTEVIGPSARIIHQGMTSSDVLDTTYSIQLTDAANVVGAELTLLCDTLRLIAARERMTLCMGRTHGMDAEPTTVGLWMLRHFDAFLREQKRLNAAIEEAAVCKISGAVGTYDLLPWEVEREVGLALDLQPAKATSQIIHRGHYVPVFASMASIMACVAALATDIRLRAQSSVMEVQEPFSKGQKGSSAMPHKKNPISCENLCGLARWVIALLPVALENVVSWGERDISHSSAERAIGPDMTITTAYALQRLRGVLERMVIYPERMRANLTRSPWWTGRLMDHLISNEGWSREQAYDAIQEVALAVLGGTYPNLLQAVIETREKHRWPVGIEEMGEMMAPDLKAENVDMIFARFS